jgi:biopolymer transport protein ExbD
MAGGGAPVPPGSGAKRSVDFQLNMVPFIDLLSVLISFLLMTSVWNQVAKIDVEPAPEQGGDVRTQEELDLTIVVKASGYTVTKRGAVVKDIDKQGQAYDVASLAGALVQQRAEHPDNNDVVVVCEDEIAYEDLVHVMDTALEHQLTRIAVRGLDGA